MQSTEAPVGAQSGDTIDCPGRPADRLGACGPTIAMLALVFVAGGIVAASAEAIAAHFGRLMLAAFCLHVLGFALGYAIPRACSAA